MNAYMPSKTIFGFLAGVAIGTLGGLIGLGGAEFRLPLLIGLFSFPALEAVMLNKAMSLVVVGSALPFRAGTVSWEAIAENWHVVLNILAGSMAGAWLGASWATVLRSDKLYRVIALLLVAIAAVLAGGHMFEGADKALFDNPFILAGSGLLAGFIIGIVAALLGVAGGSSSFLHW